MFTARGTHKFALRKAMRRKIGNIVVASSDRSTDSVDASKGVPRVNVIFTTKGAVSEIKRRNGGKTQAKTDRDTCVTVFKRTAGSR